MPILDLLFFPDEKLRAPCKEVTEFNQELEIIVQDMFETMYENNGIGLAAPQVNIHKQIIVIDIVGEKKKEDQLVLINPTFTNKVGTAGIEEGCLSVPGLRGHVDRAESVTVKAQDIKGNFFEIKANDLLAICIQHEMDHLIGKLFIDYLSPMKRNMYRAKALKLAKERRRKE